MWQSVLTRSGIDVRARLPGPIKFDIEVRQLKYSQWLVSGVHCAAEHRTVLCWMQCEWEKKTRIGTAIVNVMPYFFDSV